MSKVQGWVKPSIVFLACSAMIAAFVMLPARSDSVNWGSGGGEWVRTQAARTKDALCYNPNQGDEWCREWCELNQNTQTLVATGQFCCAGADGLCNGGDIFF